jgi:tight adherence protein C
MPVLVLGSVLLAAGVAVAAAAVQQRRLAGGEAAEWLAVDLAAPAAEVLPHDGRSFADRVLWPALRALGRAVASSTPAARLDALHAKLLHAGLSASIRAEEMLALFVLSSAGSVALVAVWVVAAGPPARLALLGAVVLVVAGTCAPRAWLERRVTERKEQVFKDLPDALDLMTIAMEAGVGFDGAIKIVTEHLGGPLGEELTRTLTEMELGRTRREALQNLKRRTDVPELTGVIVALLQADALGMPVSRVLRVQATEMRAKRRQWAREKAGKLPVKILFPLVVFIFPPVMVIIIGPVVSDITRMFG